VTAKGATVRTDFDRFESHTGVVAGLVSATTKVKARSENKRGDRDKPQPRAEKRSDLPMIRLVTSALA
jgi:hypothetical protein